MTEIRLPELSGGSEQEQLRRMQSYLYTLAEQLQFALDSLGKEQETVRVQVSEAAAKGQEKPNFAAIKALIIRSAEITEHFSEEIEKRLAGKFVAQSDFGTFTQLTEQKITANSQELRQEFTNWQSIESHVAELQSALMEVSACIRTGLLYENAEGAPIYGVEIGQQEWFDGVIRFRKFTRLTAEKLSFYDSNDMEVAYVSDSRLYITTAEVESITAKDAAITRLRMGDYTWQVGEDGHLSLR